MNVNEYACLKANNVLIWYDRPVTYFTEPVGGVIVFANAVLEVEDTETGYDTVLYVFSLLSLSLYKKVSNSEVTLRDALLDDSTTHLMGFPGEKDGKILGMVSHDELKYANWLPSENILINFE